MPVLEAIAAGAEKVGEIAQKSVEVAKEVAQRELKQQRIK